MNRADCLPLLRRLLEERILLLDGAMGTMIQSYGLRRGRLTGGGASPIFPTS
ncbi:MAG: hypothetical protein KatS3mg123_2661 [Burkholderiales bacterium]|nr:MAG: hypothetical protein KatS3mg123_2661 [Burkholderiales bacterium]